MVKGYVLLRMMDYVAKKRGVDGLNRLVDKANENGILFTKPADIVEDKDYHSSYYMGVMNGAVQVLKDDSLLKGLGIYLAEKANINFRGITGHYPPRRSVQKMVLYARENFPVFHTGYRTMSEKTYWIRVSKINNKVYPIIEGFFVKMFEIHGGISNVKRETMDTAVKYYLKF